MIQTQLQLIAKSHNKIIFTIVCNSHARDKNIACSKY